MVKYYKEGILKNIIPLMLCISIVTSCMYVYSKEYLALFVLITILIQTNVFSFYTFLSKKSMILRFISIVGSFAAISGMVTIALRTGNNKSSVDYFIWFLSPQALVDFSLPYIAATFIIINFFIASTVYYFSAVRYRISMTFMITLIPFAVYRKEGEQVPVIFALILLVMYTALMIHCRQINLKPRHKLIIDKGYKRSMIVFLAFSSLLAIVLPKPEPDIDNSWVDDVFESDKITEYMLQRLGIVSETASSSVTYTGSSNIKLFEFVSEEVPINLKSQTYSLYNYKSNLWRTGKNETKGPLISETDAKLLNPAVFYRAVSEAFSLDQKLSEKYGLKDLDPELSSKYECNVSMVSSRVPSRFYYTPVLAYGASGYGTGEEQVFRAAHGMLYSERTTGLNYTVKFYSDKSVREKDMLNLVCALDNSNFSEFLDDINTVLEKNGVTDYEDVICAYIRDYENAMTYLEESMTDIPDTVYEISEKIIRKRDSDYERAIAIQDYFNLNNFVYSLSYRKPDGYNMEYFLTEGKTGVCSDYATAMVLLARSAGIPARYAEGIHLHDPDENGLITVKDSDLHAFPELYISGFGWMAFEPTQLSNVSEGSGFDYKMSVLLAVAALILILFILFYDRYIHPFASEKIFESRIKKVSDEKSVEMIVVRIRKKLELEESTTSAEIGNHISEIYGIDMNSTVADFDRAVYGGEKINAASRTAALDIYSRLIELQKAEKKKSRMKKKIL